MNDEPSAHYLKMPHVEQGMAVGLFGGSFNPPHEGHALVAELALTRLKLDQLWWMVTPGNPLKDKRELAPLKVRIALSEGLAKNPHIRVTAFEETIGARFSADTVAYVLKYNPGVKFVWIMGADSLASFHLWQHWRTIVSMIPIAIIDRPGATLAGLNSPMAQTFARSRMDEKNAPLLARAKPPAWTFIHGPRSPMSSTLLRRREI